MTALLIYFSSSSPHPSSLPYKRCIFISRSPPSYYIESIFKHFINMPNCFLIIFSYSLIKQFQRPICLRILPKDFHFSCSPLDSWSQSLFTKGTEPDSPCTHFKPFSDEDYSFLTWFKPERQAHELPWALQSDLGLLVDRFPQSERKVDMQFLPTSLYLSILFS